MYFNCSVIGNKSDNVYTLHATCNRIAVMNCTHLLHKLKKIFHLLDLKKYVPNISSEYF